MIRGLRVHLTLQGLAVNFPAQCQLAVHDLPASKNKLFHPKDFRVHHLHSRRNRTSEGGAYFITSVIFEESMHRRIGAINLLGN